MFPALREAIAAQYVAFQAARPGKVTGCPCCTSPEQLAALVAVPREVLGPADLDFYAAKAMTTVGTPEDFRYYWPRLAEIAIAGELLTDTEILFAKPLYGAHHTWPAEERQALLRLAAALAEWLGAVQVEAGDVDMWVCAIGLLSERLADTNALLAPLVATTPAATVNLRSLVAWNRDSMRTKARLQNRFWEDAPESASRVLDWLTTDARVLAVAQAIERDGWTPPRTS